MCTCEALYTVCNGVCVWKCVYMWGSICNVVCVNTCVHVRKYICSGVCVCEYMGTCEKVYTVCSGVCEYGRTCEEVYTVCRGVSECVCVCVRKRLFMYVWWCVYIYVCFWVYAWVFLCRNGKINGDNNHDVYVVCSWLQHVIFLNLHTVSVESIMNRFCFTSKLTANMSFLYRIQAKPIQHLPISF